MLENICLYVIIATSINRTEWLINRSLKSVYMQQDIDSSSCKVIIVDDNKNEEEYITIIKTVSELRKKLGVSGFETTIMKNQRTRFMSGTGSWNTGIYKAYEENKNSFVAILDDDDEYLPHHLSDCINQIDYGTIAVFQRLFWQNEDDTVMYLPFYLEDITPESFFIGNPGIQGSNMFFKIQALVDIDGFDESLPNTTDRDLMIRFLWYFEKQKKHYTEASIKVLESIGVKHYNHQKQKVNNDLYTKKKGLDIFYNKYKAYFSQEAYIKSLERAKRFFNYIPSSYE